MKQFEQIGLSVGLDDVELSEEAAEQFYRIAHLGTRVFGLSIDDTETRVRMSSKAASTVPDAGDPQAATDSR